MKDPYEVLREKEEDLARVRHEVESLRSVSSLLSDDDLIPDGLNKKKESAGERALDGGSEATGTDGLFSSIPVSRPSLWKILKRE